MFFNQERPRETQNQTSELQGYLEQLPAQVVQMCGPINP